MLDSRGKTKGGWFFILGFNMLKPNMSNTISIGTCSSDLYIHYFFETSGTASCGTTGIYIYMCIETVHNSPEGALHILPHLLATHLQCESVIVVCLQYYTPN